MTIRLYYDNAYLIEFDAVVADTKPGCIALDQSAFYPTSGGQPFDTGIICWPDGVANVTDVTVEDGIVWHHVDAEIPIGTKVHGKIDWARRFDHMQQHAGDHMIAGAIWELFRGVTIGLHTGSDVSSIDIAMENGKTHLTDEEIKTVEHLVNRRIQENHPIRCWFPDADEMAALPLRKKPTVSEHVRIVAMGNFEMVACGGTHPDTTGQIGLVKILSTLPARGKMRLTFAAGMRAVNVFQSAYQSVRAMGAMLSADIDTSPAALQKLMDAQLTQQKEMNQKLSAATAEMILHSCETKNGASVYCCHLPFADAAILQQAAKVLLQKENTLLFLSCPRPAGCHVLFARSADRTEDMAALLRSFGARGGGKPDFAQGSCENPVSSSLPDSLL